MTGVLVGLYVAIGVGCAALRLSALAVGLLVAILAAVGAFVAFPNGWLATILMALAPMLLIECTYFLGMLVIARFTEPRTAVDDKASRKAPGRITQLLRKPEIRH